MLQAFISFSSTIASVMMLLRVETFLTYGKITLFNGERTVLIILSKHCINLLDHFTKIYFKRPLILSRIKDMKKFIKK